MTWIYLPSAPNKIITDYPSAIAILIKKAIRVALSAFGISPALCITPYNKEQIMQLVHFNDEWSLLTCLHSLQYDNHYPPHPWLQFCRSTPIIFPRVTKLQPLPAARTIFTDGSKNGTGAVVSAGQVYPVVIPASAPQRVELAAVILAFRLFPEPFNLISDSQYVVNAVRMLETAATIAIVSPIHEELSALRKIIISRKEPFFIGHVRAHTNLPGPISEGNTLADNATKFDLICSAQDQAISFHNRWHVNANTLCRRFNITRQVARHIVKSCTHCVPFLPQPSLGVNPKGLQPNHLWQMDVTHFPSFGRLQYVHVSVDLYSGVIFASAHAGEKVSDVIAHCLQAFAAWGTPKQFKTDNGPAYTSKAFADFLKPFGIVLTTGIPYNPRGQGVIERAHLTLKNCLYKQKGGIGETYRSPKEKLNIALFILNFLTLDEHGKSAADRHTAADPSPKEMVMWKDILTGKWFGPDPVLRWVRGSVCVFPQNQQTPVWVPERLTRPVPKQNEPVGDEETQTDQGFQATVTEESKEATPTDEGSNHWCRNNTNQTAAPDPDPARAAYSIVGIVPVAPDGGTNC